MGSRTKILCCFEMMTFSACSRNKPSERCIVPLGLSSYHAQPTCGRAVCARRAPSESKLRDVHTAVSLLALQPAPALILSYIQDFNQRISHRFLVVLLVPHPSCPPPCALGLGLRYRSQVGGVRRYTKAELCPNVHTK